MNTITLNADMFLQDILWSATSHAICTHTYRNGDLLGYAQLIHRNRDKFAPSLLRGYARYIRAEMNRHILVYDNVAICGRGEHDAYSCIMRYMWENEIKLSEAKNTHFRVNTHGGIVETIWREESDKGHPNLFCGDSDFNTACVLANSINKRLEITTNYKDKIEKHICVECFEADFKEDKVVRRYHPLERINTWLMEEYITKIERI